MRTIRASDIASYMFCHRAWWYQRQGIKSENEASMHSGSELHARHGRMLIISGCLRWIAYALLLVAIIILTINLTNGSALFS